MLDFHTHILPEIDDGSQSPEESLELVREELRQRVDTIVLTPHFYADRTTPEILLQQRAESYERLQAVIKDEPIQPKFFLGCEVHYYMGIGSNPDIAKLKIGDSNIILLELPFEGKWPDGLLRDVQDLHTKQGLQVVIAHVERYVNRFTEKRIVESLLDTGALLQSNANFFLNPKTRRRAMRLLESGCIHILASDCHNMSSRKPNLQAAADLITGELGKRGSSGLFQRPYDLLKLR